MAIGKQQQSRARNEGRLHEACDGLGLAVAEAMFFVGRHERLAHGHEIDERGRGIEQRIEQARQDRHRIGHDPGRKLAADQHARHRDRRVGRMAHQATARLRG